MVITIFSAPNYCDVYNNKGAVIKFKVTLNIYYRIMTLIFNSTIIVSIHTYYLISWIYLLGPYPLLQKKVYIIYINYFYLILVTEVLYHLIQPKEGEDLDDVVD